MLTFEQLLKGQVEISELKELDQINLKRLLKNAQSKKCMAEKKHKYEDLEVTLNIISEMQKLIVRQSEKVLDTTSLEAVMKKIKSIQTKKCNNKFDQVVFDECILEENRLLDLKDALSKIPKLPKINPIQVKIDELKTMKQSKIIKDQIILLESLL